MIEFYSEAVRYQQSEPENTMSFLNGLTTRRFGAILAGIIVVIGAAVILSIKACSDDSSSSGTSKGKSASAVVDSSLSNSLIDKTLTKHVDSSFVPRVSAIPIDRTSTFWKMFIFFGIAVLIYLFVRWMWVARLPAIPSSIFVALFGVTILHWLVWSLAPIWWESFYQSKAFWPVNLGIGVGAWLATIAASAGGKHINKVVWSVLGLASLVFITAAWPSHKNVVQVEPVAQAVESVNREDGHLSDRFPLSPEVDSLIDATFSKHSDSLRKVMKDIAVAESEGKQFEDGTTHVLQGKVNGRDLGLFQINDTLHGKTCLNAGFDITEIEGNAKCAELLLTRRGTTNDWCASAWRWRDGYESKPQYWTCDRTPAQLLAGTNPRGPHGDELLVADAPADSSWSQPVYTYGRETRWSAPPGVDIQILTPDGTIREQLQGQNLPNFPNVRFVRFRVKVGTGAEFSPITVIRSGN